MELKTLKITVDPKNGHYTEEKRQEIQRDITAVIVGIGGRVTSKLDNGRISLDVTLPDRSNLPDGGKALEEKIVNIARENAEEGEYMPNVPMHYVYVLRGY